MHRRIQHTATTPAHMYSNRPAQWNKIQTVAPRCPPHPVGAGGVIVYDDGGWRLYVPRICADMIYTLYSTLYYSRVCAGIIKTGQRPVFVRTPLTVFIHMRHTISQPDNFQRMHCPIPHTQSAPEFPSLRRPVCNLSGPICIDSNR